jgi:hypothetical protein
MDGFSGMTQAPEKGYEIWHVECREPVEGRGLGKYELDLAGVQEVTWERGALNGHILYFSLNIIRSNKGEWGGRDMWHAWEERNVYKVLIGKSEGKRPLGKSRCRWENGIGMDLREIGWGSVEWAHLAQDRDRCGVFVNTVMNVLILAPRSE